MELTNLEAEKCVLSCVLVPDDRDFGSIRRALELLTVEDFTDARHALLWGAALEVHKRGGPTEWPALKAELERQEKWAEIGLEYLFEVVEIMPTSTSIGYYAALVKDLSIRRRLKAAGAILADDASHPALIETTELLAEAQKRLTEIPSTQGLQAKDASTVFASMVESIRRGKAEERGLRTGFDDLDFLLRPMLPGQLIVVAARPSVGKTTLALNIATDLALRKHKRVAFFSMEMQVQELMARAMCSETGIPSAKIQNQDLTEHQIGQVERVGALFEANPMLVFDEASQRVEQIAEAARNAHRARPLDLVVVDYLQLVLTPSEDTRAQEVAHVTRSLKILARELQVPVMALSQLNRNAEKDDRPPRLADLRESGAIEQDSDVVLMIHRVRTNDHYDYSIIIGKQRNGPAETVKIGFDGSRVRFTDLTYGTH